MSFTRSLTAFISAGNRFVGAATRRFSDFQTRRCAHKYAIVVVVYKNCSVFAFVFAYLTRRGANYLDESFCFPIFFVEMNFRVLLASNASVSESLPPILGCLISACSSVFV